MKAGAVIGMGTDCGTPMNFHTEALWRELAALGVLALATPEGDGGALELVAALEALGDGVFPGPLPATFFATRFTVLLVLGCNLSGDLSTLISNRPLSCGRQ